MAKTTNNSTLPKEEKIWNQTVNLIKHGVEPQRIVAELVLQQWPTEKASEFVSIVGRYVDEFKGTPAGVGEAKHRRWMIFQAGGLWIGAAILFLLMTRLWPRSEMLPFLSGVSVLYGIYELYLGFRQLR